MQKLFKNLKKILLKCMYNLKNDIIHAYFFVFFI